MTISLQASLKKIPQIAATLKRRATPSSTEWRKNRYSVINCVLLCAFIIYGMEGGHLGGHQIGMACRPIRI